MTQNTETSVMFALAELQQAEVVRQSEERARETRRRQEQEEHERAERERRREAELQAQRIAEAAARLQLEVDTREAAARERVTAMQQALIQIQAERDVLHDHLQTRDRVTPAAPPAAVMRMALGGVALSLIAVAAMSVMLLTPPARARTHEVATKIVYLPAPAPAVVPAPAPPAAPVVVTPTVTKPLGGSHPRPLRHPTTPAAGQPNLTVCGDDPLCGLNFKR